MNEKTAQNKQILSAPGFVTKSSRQNFLDILEKQSQFFSDNPYSTGWRCGEVTQENYKIGDEPYFQFLEDHVLEVWSL